MTTDSELIDEDTRFVVEYLRQRNKPSARLKNCITTMRKIIEEQSQPRQKEKRPKKDRNKDTPQRIRAHEVADAIGGPNVVALMGEVEASWGTTSLNLRIHERTYSLGVETWRGMSNEMLTQEMLWHGQILQKADPANHAQLIQTRLIQVEFHQLCMAAATDVDAFYEKTAGWFHERGIRAPDRRREPGVDDRAAVVDRLIDIYFPADNETDVYRSTDRRRRSKRIRQQRDLGELWDSLAREFGFGILALIPPDLPQSW